MKADNENGLPREALDRALDAALTKYASAEPRAGLEERVLANLRTVETHVASTWWNWRIATLLAAVLIVAVALALRWSWLTRSPVAMHRSVPHARPAATEATNHERDSRAVRQTPVRQRSVRHAARHAIVAGNPKLDVFPSPLPLSEQERTLAIYVGQYPEHAALMAEARMDDLRQEAERRREIAAGERDQKQ